MKREPNFGAEETMTANEDSVEQLIASLRTQDAERAIEYLSRLGSSAVVPLADALSNATHDPAYAYRIMEALEKIGSPDAQGVQAVTTLLDADDPLSRLRAASVLGRIGDPQAVNPLLHVLRNDSDNRVQRAAATALGHLHAAPAVGSLINLLDNYDDGVRSAAGDALIEIGEPAVRPLLGVLGDHEQPARLRALAADTLGTLRDLRALTPIVDILLDATNPPSVRSSAARSLAMLGDTVALDPLLRVLTAQDQESSVRIAAIGAVGALRGRERAFAPFLTVLRDRGDEEIVRAEVARKLGWIGGERAIDPLISALADSASAVRAGAIQALAQWGDARAVPALQKLQEHEQNEMGGLDGIVARSIYAIKRRLGLPLTPAEDPAGTEVTRLGPVVWREPNRATNSRPGFVLRIEDPNGDIDVGLNVMDISTKDWIGVLNMLRQALADRRQQIVDLRKKLPEAHDPVAKANYRNILAHLERSEPIIAHAVAELEAQLQ